MLEGGGINIKKEIIDHVGKLHMFCAASEVEHAGGFLP